jgi:RNase adapter protein RapZ
MRLVIVTGLSGAGKSTALNAFEDSGFFCVDNLPPPLWPELVTQLAAEPKVAVVVDVRTRAYLAEVQRHVAALKTLEVQVTVVFLDAADDVLVNRYNFTRRHHPLQRASLTSDIAAERTALADLRSLADVVLDTANLSTSDLRKSLQRQFAGGAAFQVRVMSFGFKRGVPSDSDNVFDVRVMPNPYYDPELRIIDGRDPRVQAYAFSGDGEAFFQDLLVYVSSLLAKAKQGGRQHYAIAVGCTGGQHRSVAVAERLASHLKHELDVSIEHRDVAQALAEHLPASTGDTHG